MTRISPESVKNVRARTGAGIVDCRDALIHTNGKEEEAIALLQEQGKAKALKRANRETGEGCIGSYVHTTGKVAAIIALCCETDFVARNKAFSELARDLAMQVAAMDPADEQELFAQPFFRDQGKTVGDRIAETTAELGENIRLKTFVRVEV